MILGQLEPPLDVTEEEEISDLEDSSVRDASAFDIIPELQEHLITTAGGQVWGTEGANPQSHNIQVRYLLGPAIAIPKPETIEREHEKRDRSKQNSTSRHKKKKSKRKTTTRQKAIKHAADKKAEQESDKETLEIVSVRSDEELFICVSPWKQNTLMISGDGRLWSKTGLKAPVLMRSQPPIPLCSVVCGKSHAIALTSKSSVELFYCLLTYNCSCWTGILVGVIIFRAIGAWEHGNVVTAHENPKKPWQFACGANISCRRFVSSFVSAWRHLYVGRESRWKVRQWSP